MLFLPFLNHPCIGASIVLYCTGTRAGLVQSVYMSRNLHGTVGTVNPNVWRVMHRTLARPVCTLQPAQPQGQTSRCSPGYLGRPNYRRYSAKLYLLQQRGPLVWELADVLVRDRAF